MKTQILSLPRMASKQITFNLYRYFLAKYKDVSVIHKIVDIEPSLDELFNIWHHRFKYKLKSDGNNLVRTNELITSSDEEIANRCEYVKDLNGPYVIKHFPMDNDITPFLINQVDRVYTLSRNDIFNNALSICLSRISKSWIRSQYQQKMISTMIESPIDIPVDEFRQVVQQIFNYNKIYLVDTAHILEFDDICSVANSIDFCTLLDLEYIEFSFIKIGEEFGDNKTRMISNMSELQDIYLDMRA
jgi:hypothetical protein